MSARRWPWIALAGAGAAVFGAAAVERVRHPLAATLQAALAETLGLPRSAVQVGRARFGWPGQLLVRDVATPDWTAARVELTLDPWAALRGRWRLGQLRLHDGRWARGQVDDVEARLGDGDTRVALRGVTLAPGTHWLGGLGAHIGDAGLELQAGHLRRLAFADGAIGGVGQLAGSALRAADGAWLVRAARPGLTATARLDSDGADGVARLERMPLAGLPAPRGLELDSATAAGTLVFHADAAAARATLELALAGLTLAHPALARARVEGLSASLAGELTRDGDGLALHALTLAVDRAALVIDGRLDGDGELSLSARLPRLACADLLASIPRPLMPHLAGLVLDGDVSAQLALSLDLHDGATVALALDGVNGCRARADAALADVASLRSPAAATLTQHRAGGRLFPLVAANPSWRPLASLPAPLLRAFIVAEDGRFFSHHGFDLQRIGRALGADLDAGRFERGASTITQQLAKNLWLDGERTLSRKLEEALLAWRLEQVLDKRRILELYLNLVELGPGIYGVGDAAERYFGKLPEELSPDEAAQLAALPPAPRRGMDDAWARRYRALQARLPAAPPLVLPPPRPAAPPPPEPPAHVQLSRR